VDTVTETFPSAMGSGSVKITFITNEPFSPGITGLSYSGGRGVTSGLSVTTSVVPEPTAMSMLGIGMAGYFAFRRWFRRKAVA
jgi:hypothetical protein